MTGYLLLALVLGCVAGLRSTIAPAAVSWAAALGWLPLGGSWLAFLGYGVTPWILTVFVVGELVVDKLASTPSRTIPPAFGARIVSGLLCGAALGTAAGGPWIPALAGAGGAVAGTLGGRAARARLARAFGRDRPAALLEDGVALAAAALAVLALR